MRSPEEPASRGAAGAVAAMARQRYKHERTGMHVPAGQQRPTRGGKSAREMVRDASPPPPPCPSLSLPLSLSLLLRPYPCVAFTCGSPHSVR